VRTFRPLDWPAGNRVQLPAVRRARARAALQLRAHPARGRGAHPARGLQTAGGPDALGLIPSWADDPAIGNRLINARADTVATKPSFRSAFRKRRCLFLADGFFEWQSTGAKKKQPYQIRLKSGKPFAFAGLWEHWVRDGQVIESCTIVTTDAND